jgi:hypothetical protein
VLRQGPIAAARPEPPRDGSTAPPRAFDESNRPAQIGSDGLAQNSVAEFSKQPGDKRGQETLAPSVVRGEAVHQWISPIESPAHSPPRSPSWPTMRRDWLREYRPYAELPHDRLRR